MSFPDYKFNFLWNWKEKQVIMKISYYILIYIFFRIYIYIPYICSLFDAIVHKTRYKLGLVCNLATRCQRMWRQCDVRSLYTLSCHWCPYLCSSRWCIHLSLLCTRHHWEQSPGTWQTEVRDCSRMACRNQWESRNVPGLIAQPSGVRQRKNIECWIKPTMVLSLNI